MMRLAPLLLLAVAATSAQNVLLSIPVKFEEGSEPSILSLHQGQSFVEAAKFFCDANGVSAEAAEAIVPELAQALQTSLIEEVGKLPATVQVDVDERAVPVSHAPGQDVRQESAVFCSALDLGTAQTEECVDAVYRALLEALVEQFAAAQAAAAAAAAAPVEPLLTIPFSVDGAEALTMSYYAGTSPEQAAEDFCRGAMGAEAAAEGVRMCAQGVASAIQQRLQQQQQQQQGPAPTVLGRVPLSLNGVESQLDIVEGRTPMQLARDLCAQDAFGLAAMGQVAVDDCLLQVANVASQALRQLADAAATAAAAAQAPAAAAAAAQQPRRPAPLSVPITIGEATWLAEVRTGEPLADGASRFCAEHRDDLVRAFEDNEEIDTDTAVALCLEAVEKALGVAVEGLRLAVEQAELENPVVRTVEVDTGDGRVRPLQIRQQDTAATAAAAFLAEHGLGQEFAEELETTLQDKFIITER